jgi:hypothetical protein
MCGFHLTAEDKINLITLLGKKDVLLHKENKDSWQLL